MITVVTAADKRYSLQALVLAQSLVMTQEVNTRLIVLGNGWSMAAKQRLSDLSDSRFTAECVSVDDDQFKSVRLTNKFPLATAYNILAPKFILPELDRFVYVDADVIVRKDLSALFKIENKQGVSACLDAHVGWVANPTMWRPWREEGLHPNTPYLNTGVLVVDPEIWNARQLTEKTLEFLTKYDLPCVDQDALNLALQGSFDILPPTYNSMPYHILTAFRHIDLVTPAHEIEETLLSPTIIHFHRSFLGKPWEWGCIHPHRDHWRSLADEVRPHWRKTIDFTGSARRRAAKAAKMLRLDPRLT